MYYGAAGKKGTRGTRRSKVERKEKNVIIFCFFFLFVFSCRNGDQKTLRVCIHIGMRKWI